MAVIAVVLTFSLVFTAYWKGLLGLGKTEEPGPMMGGGGGMPPPPIVGLPTVSTTTLSGAAPQTTGSGDGDYKDAAAAESRFDGPSAIAVGPGGSIFVTDARNHRIRIVATDGTSSTAAGAGPSSATLGAFADGPAKDARLWNPSGVTVTPDGAVWFTDTGNHRVRRLRGGTVRTVAGGDTPRDRLGLQDGGFADGGGTQARFRYPTGIASLADGSVLVVDTGNCRLRKVAPDGTTTTVADLAKVKAQSPCGVAVLPDGTALVVDPAAEAIFSVAPTGEVALLPGINKDAPIWRRPTGIAANAEGTVYVADTGSHCIMRLVPGGAPQNIAGMVEIDNPGPGYANGTGDMSTFAAPCGIAIAGAGTLYIADYGNNCVRKVVLGPGT